MSKKLFYIFGITTAALTSCSDDDVVNVGTTEYLNGTEKTPITVVTNLQTTNSVTRAVNDEFETNDLLNAYIKHVTVGDADANPLVYSADVSGTGVGPRLANFQVTALTADHKNEADNWKDHTTTSTLKVTDAEGLYWDDFSNSASDGTDLRTSGHALMVYYGFGYNGGTPSAALGSDDDHKTEDGVLGWTVATDQTSGFKTSDLLYAGKQDPVAYTHGTDNTITGRDRVLNIPYTHAMSKVTIEVNCEEGFEADASKNFGSAVVKLHEVGTTATVTGPTKAVSKGTTPANIIMQKLTPADNSCSFSALMAPTVIKAGDTFATIEGIDGNNYTISLTHAAITTATATANVWSNQLAMYDATSVTPNDDAGYTETYGGLTKPGVHYMLTVTIKKQEIQVSATIQNWEAVKAAAVGVMDFSANIKSSEASGTPFTTDGAKFNLWRSTTNTNNEVYDEKGDVDGVNAATTLTYNESLDKWTADPKIYWPNNNTPYYFRALAKYNETNYVEFGGENASHTATTDLKVYQGTDLVWGTTAAHTGTDEENGSHNFNKGDIISPRTSEVPLEFDHAMSKISVLLDGGTGVNAINVTDATISIVNIYDNGTVSLKDGSIIDLNASGKMPIKDFGDKNSSASNKLEEYCVIPQSLLSDKEGVERSGATTFYTPNDLTVIYDSNNSSIGEGGSKTYVTSTLTPYYYNSNGISDSESYQYYNKTLPGHVTTESDKEVERQYTLDEYNALSTLPHTSISEMDYNNLDEVAKTKEAARPYTLDEFKALTSLSSSQFEHLPNEWKNKPPYTKEEADAENANLSGAVKEGDKKPNGSDVYTADEAAEYNRTLDGAVLEGFSKGTYTLEEYNALVTKPIANITPDEYDQLLDLSKTKPVVYYTCEEFRALTELSQDQFNALSSVMRTRPAVKYTQVEADAYNAKLPGAKSTMDVHHYETNGSSTTAVAGDIKSNGNRVVLHIMLADKTGYTLDLATCKDSNPESSTYNQAITTWLPSKHYTYTITLGKEEIIFRALIKEWEEVSGGGNANLDW